MLRYLSKQINNLSIISATSVMQNTPVLPNKKNTDTQNETEKNNNIQKKVIMIVCVCALLTVPLILMKIMSNNPKGNKAESSSGDGGDAKTSQEDVIEDEEISKFLQDVGYKEAKNIDNVKNILMNLNDTHKKQDNIPQLYTIFSKLTALDDDNLSNILENRKYDPIIKEMLNTFIASAEQDQIKDLLILFVKNNIFILDMDYEDSIKKLFARLENEDIIKDLLIIFVKNNTFSFVDYIDSIKGLFKKFIDNANEVQIKDLLIEFDKNDRFISHSKYVNNINELFARLKDEYPKGEETKDEKSTYNNIIKELLEQVKENPNGFKKHKKYRKSIEELLNKFNNDLSSEDDKIKIQFFESSSESSDFK